MVLSVVLGSVIGAVCGYFFSIFMVLCLGVIAALYLMSILGNIESAALRMPASCVCSFLLSFDITMPIVASAVRLIHTADLEPSQIWEGIAGFFFR